MRAFGAVLETFCKRSWAVLEDFGDALGGLGGVLEVTLGVVEAF